MIKKIKEALKNIRFSVIRLLSSDGNVSAAYLGRTFAIGLSAGLFFFYGQMVVCLLLWLLLDKWLKLKFNLFISCLLTFISNPLTTPFIFYIYYLTGSFVFGKSAVSFSELMRQLRAIVGQLDFAGLYDGIKILLNGVMKPIIIGSIPWHIVAAAVGYWLGVRMYKRLHAIINRRKNRKSKKQ